MKPVDRMHLGARIKHLREYRKISTRDMAKRLEMDHVQYLNDVEGTEQVSDWVLDRVSNELDFPADYIRDWMENPIYFTQHINDSGVGIGHSYGTGNTYGTYINNPLDKIIELYEKLLQIEREKNGTL